LVFIADRLIDGPVQLCFDA
jgi:hypothetical protein